MEPLDRRRFAWLRRGWLIALLWAPLVLGGCTEKLWRERSPKIRVWIPPSRITEDQLRQEGRAYDKLHLTKQELRDMGIRCKEDEVDGYLAEKSRGQMFGDRVVMVAGTPVTIAIDIALIPVVLFLLVTVGD